jgi:uncharacterized OsmC-like protein
MLALTFAAFFAAAQPVDEPPPPPELTEAGNDWNACVQDRVEEADEDLSPARTVDAALAACRPLQEAMTAHHRRWVDGSNLSAREKTQALRTMEQSLTQIRPQFIRMVREMRED